MVAWLSSGCGKSTSDSNESAKSTPASTATGTQNAQAPPTAPTPPASPVAPSPPAQANIPAAPATPATPAMAAAQPPAVTPVPDQSASVKNAAVESVSQFATTASARTDKVAASIGSELAAKAQSLTQSAANNPQLKTQLAGALQSLSAGKDASALGTLFQQAKQANLTPQQTQLVKDVGNLASAYVVQRNFSSLDGAQGDVATIVNSLRQGSIMPAVPALQSLAQNASLTPQQKDLLGTLADQYAPGLKKTSDSLKQGLQSLQGVTK